MNDVLTVQNVISALLFVILSFAGNWLRHLQKSFDELKAKNDEQDKFLQELKLEIVQNFQPRSESEKFFEKTFSKIDEIKDLLNTKADKAEKPCGFFPQL